MRAFVLALALLIGLVLAVNAVVAWDTIVHEQRMREAAARFASGQALLDYRDSDERRFQRARLAVIPPPRIVAFGSSRVMLVSTAMVGAAPGEFYNAGLSGASVEDFIVVWSRLARRERIPTVALFVLDQWTFNRAHDQLRGLEWADDVNRVLDASGGRRALPGLPVDDVVYRWLQAKELVSYTVLKSSLGSLDRLRFGRERRGTDIVRALERGLVPEADLAGRRGLRADGSLVYDRAYEAQTPAQVREIAARYAVTARGNLGGFRWDAKRAERLERLWEDMHARGVRIVAFLPPFHPEVWHHLVGDPRLAAALTETDGFLRRLGARVEARYADFSDAATVPCSEAEFLDGSHARPACMERLLRKLL